MGTRDKFEHDRFALFLSLAFLLLCGCGGAGSGNTPAHSTVTPLPSGNINMVFVVSPDLDYQADGDVDPKTANLTAQGLQRTLLMAPYLQQSVLNNRNVTAIYALAPITHLQTVNGYPDMAPLEAVQQFSFLNSFTMYSDTQGDNATPGHNYPINVSYALGSVPNGVAIPSPLYPCPACQGLDFNDLGGDNETLLTGIVNAGVAGDYVFSAPWETTHTLLDRFNTFEHYNLTLPSSYQGPNHIFGISITPSKNATFTNYDSNLSPLKTYPTLDPGPVVQSACQYASFTLTATGPPTTINKNETLYFIRHSNAHPNQYFSDGDFVAQGQWRALYLGTAIPRALAGKPQPTHIYSLDPSQITPNAGISASGPTSFSHNTLALTAAPYAIASKLPYTLVSSFLLTDTNGPQEASDYFFQGSQFDNQTILVAWEHSNIPQILGKLLASYGNVVSTPPLSTLPSPLAWNALDYDSIWAITIDANGNLSANNSLCEGIDSNNLPQTAPLF